MRWIIVSGLLLLAGSGYAQEKCGIPASLQNRRDYTDRSPDNLKFIRTVEQYHFTPKVEFLREGQSASLVGDIQYTLNLVPNHHRALMAISKYERQQIERHKMLGKPPYRPPITGWGGFTASAECYFRRALHFRPNDPIVHMIQGIHLHLSGQLNEALQAYKTSEKLAPNYSELHYNMGLLYFDRGEYVHAKKHAQKAYELGYQLSGLRDKLAGVGQWP